MTQVLVISVPSSRRGEGLANRVSPGPHVDIYRRSDPAAELKWVGTVWEPRELIEYMAWEPMWAGADGLILFPSVGGGATCVNAKLEVVKQQPKKFLNQGNHGLLYSRS